MITLSIENGLVRLQFQGQKSNALDSQTLAELGKTISELGQNPLVKVILLSSAGEQSFCAGASFHQLVSIDNLVDAEAFFGGFAGLLCQMRDCPKTIVLQVQGKATGGGVGLISAADYVVASPQAAVALTEINIGIGPFVIGPFVARKIGASAFNSMALDAQFRDAPWALAHDLFDVVSTNHETLSETTDAFVAKLLNQSGQALQKLKQMAWHGHNISDDLLRQRQTMSAQLLLSPETKGKIADFLGR
jgi:methylglutaconyl-CoA hydratase